MAIPGPVTPWRARLASAWPLMYSTFMPGWRTVSVSATSRPLMPGITTSVSSSVKGCAAFAAIRSASVPSAADSTWNPARVSTMNASCRTASSSSTSRMRAPGRGVSGAAGCTAGPATAASTRGR